jgi:hypothetical protein
MGLRAAIAAGGLLMAVPALGQTSGARSSTVDFDTARFSRIAEALRIDEDITIDGRLAEPVWRQTQVLGDFITHLPREGLAATEKTEVRLLYDDENLYVGFVCFDSDIANLIITELREDFNFGQNDVASVSIDSLHDRRSGFFFNLNPGGARRDGQIFNDGQNNPEWDGVWDGKTSILEEGWSAEFVIPFKTLRFSQAATQEWGLNLGRRIGRLSEESQWSPIPARFGGLKISLAGTLRGLEGIRQGRNLKVKPFVTAGTSDGRGPDGELHTLRSLTRMKDYDGGMDLKYSITPSLTLDATYRTDFAQVEVDQQQVNLTRFNVFFPEKRDFFLENSGTFGFGGGGTGDNLLPFFSRRIGLSSTGTQIPIVGGTRVSGQIDRYDVGALTMRTERLGQTPANNYLVGRVKRNVFARSFIGALATSRDSTVDGDYNRVFGADAYFVFFNKLEIDSYMLKSDTPGRSGGDQARKLATAWRGDEWVIGGEYNTVQPDFNPEVGFVRRRETTQYSGELSWLPRLQRSWIRNLVFGATAERFESSRTGRLETETRGLSFGIQQADGGSINVNIDRTFDRLTSQFRIRPSVPIPAGDYEYDRYSARFSTSGSRRIAGNGNLAVGEFWNGHLTTFGGTLNLRPSHHFNVGLDYSRNSVDLPGGDFTTDLVGARFLYSFSPRAFLNSYLQYNTDTHEVSSNVRFNIIHHPLSDLYLVYNERRDTEGGRLVERAVIVKLTNLFNF